MLWLLHVFIVALVQLYWPGLVNRHIFWQSLRLGDLDPRRIQSIPQDVLRLHLFWP